MPCRYNGACILDYGIGIGLIILETDSLTPECWSQSIGPLNVDAKSLSYDCSRNQGI